MEPNPHYSLPFRHHGTRLSSTWPAQLQPPAIYTVVTPGEHPQQYQQQLAFLSHQYSHPHPAHGAASTDPHPQPIQPQPQPQHPHEQPQQTPEDLQKFPQLPFAQQQQSVHQYGVAPTTFITPRPERSPTAMQFPAQQTFAVPGHSYDGGPPPPQSKMLSPLSPMSQLLPRPSSILPSQEADGGPCLACGKRDCQLSSHRHFSRHLLTNPMKKTGTSPLTVPKPNPDATPRPVPAVPVSPRTKLTGQPSTPAIPPLAPLGLDVEQQHLLHLWHGSWFPQSPAPSCIPERHLFPLPAIESILPYAQHHPPLLHALLAYSGTMASIATNDPTLTALAQRQHQFAVELLSQACPTEAEAGTDSAMLAATLLLSVYLARGNSFEVQKHVSGLVHLCKLRGGPHYLGMGGKVAECLMSSDRMQAVWFNTAPVWDLTLPPVGVDTKVPMRFGGALNKFGGSSSAVLTAYGIVTDVAGGLGGTGIDVNLDVVNAFRSVCRVADIHDFAIQHGGGPSLPREAQNGYSYLIGVAEYQLARCNAIYQGSGTVNECITCALVLFGYVVLGSDAAVTPLLEQAEYRLWTALKVFSQREEVDVMIAKLYVWMCFTGLSLAVLLAKRGDSTQYWALAVQSVVDGAGRARLGSWDEVRTDVLEPFVWIAPIQEDTFRRAWAEVESLMRKGRLLPPGG